MYTLHTLYLIPERKRTLEVEGEGVVYTLPTNENNGGVRWKVKGSLGGHSTTDGWGVVVSLFSLLLLTNISCVEHSLWEDV